MKEEGFWKLFFSFAGEHPVATFFFLWAIAWICSAIFNGIRRCF